MGGQKGTSQLHVVRKRSISSSEKYIMSNMCTVTKQRHKERGGGVNQTRSVMATYLHEKVDGKKTHKENKAALRYPVCYSSVTTLAWPRPQYAAGVTEESNIHPENSSLKGAAHSHFGGGLTL